MNTFPLEDKTCFITGGLGGYGQALVEIILKRGGKAFVGDVKSQAEGEDVISSQFKDAAGRVAYGECDVTKQEQFDAAFVRCKNELGVPEVVINLAGIAGEENWERMYDVNIYGVHRGIELGMKHMSASSGGKGGVIVNVASTVGVTCHGDMYATPAYTASKHAVVALTRTFGHDLYFKRTGVRVVAIAPYYIETPFVDDQFAKMTNDSEALQVLRKSAEGKPMLQVGEAALKLVNILNSKNGSVWMIRPKQMQPHNIPDYRLPNQL